MDILLRALLAIATTIGAGCSGTFSSATIQNAEAVGECSDELKNAVAVSVHVAIPEPASAVGEVSSIAAWGEFDRRVIVMLMRQGLVPRDAITSVKATIEPFGGTFSAWRRFESANLRLEPVSSEGMLNRASRSKSEEVFVTLDPGRATVLRMGRQLMDLSGSQSIDLHVKPGGVVVDDTLVKINRLWNDDGSAVSSSVASISITPLRRPPGFDVVEATVNVSSTIRIAGTGESCRCLTEQRVTLVDQNTIRQPLWDLGLAGANGLRLSWLVLMHPANGYTRVVFDSPTAANSLANWIKATGATRIGEYALGVVQPVSQKRGRPFGPLDPDSMKSFRQLKETELHQLKLGALGER